MKRNMSRRSFLRLSGGLGASALLLANGGLPSKFLQTQSGLSVPRAFAQDEDGVEVIIGDVLDYQLTSEDWEGEFGYVTFQLHQALFNGDSVYYIRTDASEQSFAEENGLVFVPLLNAALSAEGATSQLYTFDGGAAEQLPVVSSVPSEEDYSPAWQVHTVTFNGDPILLESAEAVLEAEAAGDITIEAAPLVVNFPIVKWADGELQEDTEKTAYLGTGPLVVPVDTEAMEVTFKLHECFPGSRYIVTDTSAPPMAEGMNLAASPPTQALQGVGATDEIWVFGNGIEGSGVMGFQKAIFDNAAGSPIWSPFWDHFTAVWSDDADPVILTNSADLRAAADAGELEIFNGTPNTHPDGFIVNCPVPIKAPNS